MTPLLKQVTSLPIRFCRGVMRDADRRYRSACHERRQGRRSVFEGTCASYYHLYLSSAMRPSQSSLPGRTGRPEGPPNGLRCRSDSLQAPQVNISGRASIHRKKPTTELAHLQVHSTPVVTPGYRHFRAGLVTTRMRSSQVPSSSHSSYAALKPSWLAVKRLRGL
jgi:hypothetical protein